jgi:soluble lytic murein transglycosylase
MTAQAESGNRDYYSSGAPVVSPKGARFAMQVMPSTAHDPGFGIAPAKDNSPSEYNRVGRQYLDMLYNRYGGDPAKMWAAYNAGPGRLDDAISMYGENWLQNLPGETQDYVRNNMQLLGN